MYINTEEDRADAMHTDFVESDLIPEVSHLPASYTSPGISPIFSAYF